MGVPNFNSDALNIEITECEIISCTKKLKMANFQAQLTL